MTRIELAIQGVSVAMSCSTLALEDELGMAWSATVEVTAAEAIETRPLLGRGAALLLEGERGTRVLDGLVAEVEAVATAQRSPARRYRLVLRSELYRLELAVRTRIFQHLSVPDVIGRVLERGGVARDRVRRALQRAYAPRRYLVQYAERDAAFLRRLCEEEGLWLRAEGHGEDARFVLEDTSTAASAVEPSPIALVDGHGLHAARAVAFEPELRRQHRPGRVTLRDHDPARPALALEGRADAGATVERSSEIYRAPGRFSTPDEGARRARLALEQARVDTEVLRFSTTALALAPGLAVALDNLSGDAALEAFAGAWFVVRVGLQWSAAEPSHRVAVEAVPLSQSWRPALRTPRPRIAGVHPAVVTGPAGSEIHADAAGCVRVRFPWDREGPVDHGSSLPVRVAQPNMPGSMLLPRVGWEVLVAFEDGDPDRPFIVGRVYNAKSPPPFGLPANRTITSMATSSSPGGTCQNSVHFDDAAGRQHMAWNAGFGKTTTVGNDMATQTVGNEVCKIGGSETVSIGAADKLSVTQPYVVDIGGAQNANVGGSQTLTVHGDMGVTTGAESVVIGAALIEQVGDPVAGLKGLATSAAMELVGSLPKVGAIAGALGGVAMAAIQGYQKGGLEGAASAAAYGAAKAAVGAAAGMFPGADAAVAAVEGTGQAPWTPPQQVDASKAAAGGGAAGPSAAGDAGGGGGGQRVTKVDASMSQLIGAMHVQATPGNVKTTVLGPTTRLVGGDHNVRAVRVSARTMGASVDTLGSLDIVAGKAVTHSAKGAHGCTVAGGLTCKSGGPTVVAAEGALEVTVGGALSLKGGGVLLKCGDSMVVVAGGGVLLKASTVTIDGKVIDGGKGTTP